ncbi:MAG: phage head-tail adapter protein [Brevundimonas sp.]|uniref:phage head-tail adapter protein n=1 Tax=Brevundimonas sp. TaxID=1871086 RepID=UPI002737079E|nr:phage head-tail adapter protein [Brevundimonas sp.]MDP3655636.1 phage head-tail adapter protein [Brevundimonas sp.]MDZ4114168.1 phage head-tail adapter protein [Brevundimonas sp.]
MRVLADLCDGVESETPYGGRAVSWEPLGSAWLKLGARRRRERSEPGGVRVVETVTAETRSDSRMATGRVLRFGGGDWRIVSGETVGGRAILNLERTR